MVDPNDDLFNAVAAQREEDLEQSEHVRQVAYEAKVVKRLLTEAGFKPSKWEGVTAQAREFTNADSLSFEWFREMYPAFPVVLFSAKIRWVHNTKWIHFFKRFKSTTIYRKFEEMARERDIKPDKTYVGLIFEMGEFGTMVLHNYPRHPQEVLGEGQTDEGTRLVKPLGKVVYVIEQISSFVAAVGTNWVQ